MADLEELSCIRQCQRLSLILSCVLMHTYLWLCGNCILVFCDYSLLASALGFIFSHYSQSIHIFAPFLHIIQCETLLPKILSCFGLSYLSVGNLLASILLYVILLSDPYTLLEIYCSLSILNSVLTRKFNASCYHESVSQTRQQ